MEEHQDNRVKLHGDINAVSARHVTGNHGSRRTI